MEYQPTLLGLCRVGLAPIRPDGGHEHGRNAHFREDVREVGSTGDHMSLQGSSPGSKRLADSTRSV